MTARYCARCGHGPLQAQHRPGVAWPDQHAGRGLCAPCYNAERRSGELIDRPRVTRSWAGTVEDAELLRRRDPGLTWPQVAKQLGISFRALDMARRQVRARERAGSEAA